MTGAGTCDVTSWNKEGENGMRCMLCGGEMRTATYHLDGYGVQVVLLMISTLDPEDMKWLERLCIARNMETCR